MFAGLKRNIGKHVLFSHDNIDKIYPVIVVGGSLYYRVITLSHIIWVEHIQGKKLK